MLRRALWMLALVLSVTSAYAWQPRRSSSSSRRTSTARSHERSRDRHRRRTPVRRRPARRVTPAVRTPLPVIASTPRPAIGTASEGCRERVANPPRGVSEQTISVGGVTRTYLLSAPERVDSHGAPMPLVFAFHGLTGTPTSLRGYLRLEREAAGQAIFVYPAGQRTRPEPGRGTTRWDLRADGADVAFFDALVTRLAHTYCVDMGRVFAVGHSAGAVVTNEMGCHRGNVLRAIAPIAGSGPWARRCAEAPSVWVTHGRADDKVAFHYGETTRDRWVTEAGCTEAPVALDGTTCVRYAGCRGGGRVDFCVHGGDHGPPPFAPRSVWSFFMATGAH